ncbi:type VI secretion system contractile sheath small subunit, partial [Burkholderia sp. AU4i]
AIARNVDALRRLLEARTELSNLLSYMDGKHGAEQLIERAINDPDLLKTLVREPHAPAQGRDAAQSEARDE